MVTVATEPNRLQQKRIVERTSSVYNPFDRLHLRLFAGERSTVVTFKVNGKQANVDVDPSTPFLWVLRENLGLTGTKFGCGMPQCAACTLHINGQALPPSLAPLSPPASN